MAEKRNRRTKPSPSVGATADARLEASYNVKKTINQNIPEDVTRARNSAWLDLISPLTEWAGLKGDELRARRDTLRLQREETLNEIVAKALKKIDIVSTQPIPTKFTVNFLEKSSLEEAGSSLIDLWSELLVSASEKYKPYHTHFVSIIGSISPSQADIFKSIVRVKTGHNLETAIDNIQLWYSSVRISELVYREMYEKMSLTREDFDEHQIGKILSDIFSQPCVDPVYISFDMPRDRRQKDTFELPVNYQIYSDEREVDYSILEAVGLIRRAEVQFSVADIDFGFTYYYVTSLGGHFATSCGIVTK